MGWVDKPTITEMKNIIKPTFYWQRKRLARKWMLFKLEFINAWKESIPGKYIFD